MSSKKPFTLNETNAIFSRARLEHLKGIYHLSDKNTLLLHAQLSQINGSIYASTSLFEIHLRNIITNCLDDVYSPDDWFVEIPFTGHPSISAARNLKSAINRAKKSAKKNTYSKLPYAQRKQLKENYPNHPEFRRKQFAINSISVLRDDLIPHLYFSFWRSLFSRTYEPLLWNRGLRNVFPNKKVSRGDVSNYLETIHKVRIRISHNEFIHPNLCHKYVKAITFLTKQLRYKGKIRPGRVYQFHASYIDRIKLQLLELEHFLKLCS